MNKSVILFGAGASYGSDQGIPLPVLGNDLFDVLSEMQPNVFSQIVDETKQILKQDFELGIKILSEENPHILPDIQRLMAKYFFQFIPSESNLYFKLAIELKKRNWYGSLITLNYDRLLERSFYAAYYNQGLGFPTDPSKQLIELCLPHGICNLFCESVKGLAKNISFAGQNVTTNGAMIEINDTNDFLKRINEDAFPPVMCYFEPNKRTTSGASFIDFQRERYNYLIINAKKIVIIGLKLRIHDTHIWEPIKASNADILYVSGKQSGFEFESWCNEFRPEKNNEILNSYFLENFNKIIEYLTEDI
jgi:hypothetical protein